MRKILPAFSLLLSLLVPAASHAAEVLYWSPQTEEHPSTIALKGFVGKLQALDPAFAESRLLAPREGGSQSQLTRAVQEGRIGVAVMNAPTVARLAPEAAVLSLPFLFRDARALFAQLDGEAGKSLEQRLAARGLILLGWFDGGSRSLYLRERPQSVADLASAKVRVPDRADLRNLVSTLGGTPTTIAYDQVNAAFDNGSIDAAENDILSYEADQHYKHARYFVSNSHFVQFEALVMSAEVWKNLSDEVRQALREAGRTAALADREMWARRSQQARVRLEREGVKFIETSSAINSRVAPLYRPYMENPVTSPLLVRLMTSRS